MITFPVITPTEGFIWGFCGSLAVEVITLNSIYISEAGFPARYKKFWFWILRFMLAVVAGGLAVAYKIDQPILAANIGAATPLIIQSFMQGIRVPAPESALPSSTGEGDS